MKDEGEIRHRNRRLALSSPGEERNPAEYAILGLLAEEPRHGYDLTRVFAFDTELGQVCHLEMSMLYALLKKLERDGLIDPHPEAVSPNKIKRIYRLTEAGQQAFTDWVERPVEKTREIRLNFLVKLYFARRESEAAARQLLDEQLAHSQSALKRLLQERQEAIEQGLPETHFGRMVLELRIKQNEAVVGWLEDNRAKLHAWL
jgi:DNA-binding PadR family transcriptional regulator